MSQGFDTEAVFNDDYLYFYADPTVPAAELEAVLALGELHPGTSALDLACGHGRIANAVARRGVAVTALDRNGASVMLGRERARAEELDVTYVEGDMLALPFDARFDAVLIWHTSFGYFSETDNARAVAEAARALKPGGRLVVEQLNRRAILRNEAEFHGLVRKGDDMVVSTTRYDLATDRTETDRTVVRDGVIRRTHYSVRLYGVPEFRAMFAAAGLEAFEAFGQNATALDPLGRSICVRGRRPLGPA